MIEPLSKTQEKKLLFHNNKPWKKKSGEPDFDVAISCYDRADIYFKQITQYYR